MPDSSRGSGFSSGRGKRATKQQTDQFYNLVKEGFSIAQAARAVGLSPRWGYDKMRGINLSVKREEEELPDPKPWAELDPYVQDTLKDFLLFRKVFLARDEQVWAKDAADRTVEWLLNPDRRDFGVANIFPGAGKTTAWTHDLIVWLICGGGFLDPARGRALRIMVGSEAKKVSINCVRRIRNTLDLKRPYYDKEKQQHAELCLVEAFGRFRPTASKGEDSLWRADQFLVAQMVDMDLYEKEPTVQAVSKEAGFLGERCNLAIWDDLVNKSNSKNSDVADSLYGWWTDEAETRVEPGGVLLLVGQRIGNLDLYRRCLDATRMGDNGVTQPKYHHIVYPAHLEDLCPTGGRVTEECVQWDGANKGCLLDSKRLPVSDLQEVSTRHTYRTVYQQEDANPDDVLVQSAWIYGGKDADGWDSPGCLDHDRTFWEIAPGNYVVYATVDPSVSNFWAIEVWAYEAETQKRYLLYGTQRRMRAGLERGFLDWDHERQEAIGLMEDLQRKSIEIGHHIQVWVIEANIGKYLFQTNAFQRWRQKYPWVDVIPHTTHQHNKGHEEYGVDALLGMAYKVGLKRLPFGPGTEVKQYIKAKIQELTKYPQYPTYDTVMADWFGEHNLKRIIHLARNRSNPSKRMNSAPPGIPAYVLAQQGVSS